MSTRKKYFDVIEKIHELRNKKPSERTVISIWKYFMANPELRILENFRQLIFVLEKHSFISINKSGDQSINVTSKGLDWLENPSKDNELWL